VPREVVVGVGSGLVDGDDVEAPDRGCDDTAAKLA
jgi:hypothetical protein